MVSGRALKLQVLIAIALVAGVGLIRPALVNAHPLHTTMSRVTRSARTTEISIRAFADDFLFAATGRRAENAATAPAPDDSSASRYVMRTVRLRDARGALIPLVWCGLRREGEVVWLCVRVKAATPVTTLENRMLMERFEDQVNVMRVESGSVRSTLLFTRSRPTRPFP